MFSQSKHLADIKQLRAELGERDQRINDLVVRAVKAERDAHKLVEQMRYVLEVAGYAGRATDAEAIAGIGHVLPYVLSGRRHWDEPAMPDMAAEHISAARRIAAAHGFELPDDPAMAVASLLDVAAMLFNPDRSFPVEGWRNMRPLRSTVDQAVTVTWNGSSAIWSAASGDDGHRRCRVCGAFVRDNADLGQHCCQGRDDD